MPRLRKLPVQASDPIIEDDQTPPTEDIVIELADEDIGATVVEIVPPVEKKVEPAPVVTPTDADGALQRALQAQQRAEELARAAAARLAERDEELVRERTERVDAEYNSVLTSIAAEQSAIDKAESDYAAYAAAGDWAAAGKAQREMAIAATRVDRLEDNKRTFDQRREAAKVAPAPKSTPPAPQDFEQRLTALGLPEKAQGWLRSHPEFINDSSRNGELGAVHNYLKTTKRIEPFSQAYFDALDGEFGFKAPTKVETPVEPILAPQAPRRSIPMSAPVSRDVPATNGQRPSSQSMTLTPEERVIARTSFTATDMTVAQKEMLYAKNKAKLARERANGQYPSREQA